MKTIVIADDIPSPRRAQEITLKNAGYSVLSGSDGREHSNWLSITNRTRLFRMKICRRLKGSEMFKVLTADPKKKHIPCILKSGFTASGDKPANTFADSFAKGPDLSAQLIEALERLA